MTITTLKRLESDLGAVGGQLFDLDGFGFQQIGLHSDFLSIPPARYTGKADEAPGATQQGSPGTIETTQN
jgi:hypothetical protein